MNSTASWWASLVVLPVIIIIDKPGQYITRCGEIVTVTAARGHAAEFDCVGYYLSGGEESWHRSGRLYFGILSRNDIVRPLDTSRK